MRVRNSWPLMMSLAVVSTSGCHRDDDPALDASAMSAPDGSIEDADAEVTDGARDAAAAAGDTTSVDGGVAPGGVTRDAALVDDATSDAAAGLDAAAASYTDVSRPDDAGVSNRDAAPVSSDPCGDGQVQGGEECDLGAENGGPQCNADCTRAVVRFDFDSYAELSGWSWDPDAVELSDGTLKMQAGTLRARPAPAASEQAWYVEFRLRVLEFAADEDYPELRVGSVVAAALLIEPDLIYLYYPGDGARASVDPTSYHTYRVQYLGGGRYQLAIDGALVADIHEREPTSAVVPSDPMGGFRFDDGGSTEWDYVEYYLWPSPVVDPDGDVDADGVTNDLDNCSLIANAMQDDRDADGSGDSCDFCPRDPDDDHDEDGICADQDPCPDDPSNDSDDNGICDAVECAELWPLELDCPPVQPIPE